MIPSKIHRHPFLADRIECLDDANSLDVLEAAGVCFGFGEAICTVGHALVFSAAIETGWSIIDVHMCDLHEGSSIRLMAPLMQADERWTMNE
jgi:hypothetical protein